MTVDTKHDLLPKGFHKKERIEYDDIFALVVRHTSIRILLSIVPVNDLELQQMNVKTAFLHGDLVEIFYMAHPEGFEVAWTLYWVCKLYRSLYGLKQSPHQWYNRLIESKDSNEIDNLKKKFMATFEMKDLRAAKKILGMEITRDGDKRKLTLTQVEYVKKVLWWFNMESAKVSSTPYLYMLSFLTVIV